MGGSEPLISVVVPTYNQSKFIEASVESVLRQSYKNLQVIIGDDCSKDGTSEILKKLAEKDNRIELHINNVNKGICGNFNSLFDAVRGEYVVFFQWR